MFAPNAIPAPTSAGGDDAGAPAGDLIDTLDDGERYEAPVVDETIPDVAPEHMEGDALGELWNQAAGGTDPLGLPDDVDLSADALLGDAANDDEADDGDVDADAGDTGDGTSPNDDDTDDDGDPDDGDGTSPEAEDAAPDVEAVRAEAAREAHDAMLAKLAEAGIEAPELGEGEDLADLYAAEVKANAELTNVLTQDPRIVQVLRRMKDGDTLTEALAMVNLDIDDDDPEVIAARARQQAISEKDQEAIEAAEAAAAKARANFQSERGLSDDEMNTLASRIAPYIYGDDDGRLPSDFWTVFERGLNYEADVEAARAEGAKKGRNETISKRRSKKQQRGDGLPSGRRGAGKTKGAARQKEAESLNSIAASLSSRGVLDDMLDGAGY